MLRAVLFDVDGTLVDSNEFHVLAWAEALHRAGHDFRLRELHQQIGQGTDNFLRALLPDLAPDEVERLGDEHGRLFRRHYADRLKPFPSARDLLERCKAAGLKVILASSASAAEMKRHLDLLDARGIVDGWVDAGDVARSKPCPDIFEAALAKAEVGPAEAIVVGDSPYDIQAAEHIGLAVIAVRSGLFGNGALHGALRTYDDVADLLDRFDDSPLNPASAPG